MLFLSAKAERSVVPGRPTRGELQRYCVNNRRNIIEGGAVPSSIFSRFVILVLLRVFNQIMFMPAISEPLKR